VLAYGPTNLKVGLTPDEARAIKVRRSYWHVLEAVERVFRALAPEPLPNCNLAQSARSRWPSSVNMQLNGNDRQGGPVGNGFVPEDVQISDLL